MDLAREDLTHGRVIQAAEQTSGRGRRGNQWSSPKGNLYQSIVLKPKADCHYWGQLSFVIAVALMKALGTVTIDCPQGTLKLNLKWPNDVLVNDKKLAGILIEAHGDHVIIGTGVNVEMCPDDRAKLHDFCLINVNDFRDIFLDQIKKDVTMWEYEGFAPIRAEWLRHAYRLGEDIQARLPQEVYNGVFEGLNENGVLLLRQKDGSLREIHSGEIIACS